MIKRIEAVDVQKAKSVGTQLLKNARPTIAALGPAHGLEKPARSVEKLGSLSKVA